MESIIINKSFTLATKLLRYCKKYHAQTNNYVVYNQSLKSGTSIGANVEEAHGAQSKKDFRMKMFIAYKEARETRYWLRLIDNVYGLNEDLYLIEDVDEICRIIGKILVTVKYKS